MFLKTKAIILTKSNCNINWNLRYIESKPKLKSWQGNFESQSYENPIGYRDLEIVEEAIAKIIRHDKPIKKTKDIKEELPTFKAYFKDLGF